MERHFKNNCNARLLTKLPQTRQEMGHSYTTHKLISTLLHEKIHIETCTLLPRGSKCIYTI